MTSENRLTAIVLAQDCQGRLPDCLKSLGFADRVLVVDSGSRDRTREVAAESGAVVLEHPLERFDQQRNWAQEQARTPWVLFVDSDERVPDELAREVRAVVDDSTAAHVAYEMPRRNFFLGRAIRHCGWGGDRVTRLLRPERVRWDGSVHEKPRVEGSLGTLSSPLLHHTYPTIAAYWDKMDLYTRLKAAQDRERGKRSGYLRLLLHPKAVFLRMYVLQGGWREGPHGLILCMLSAFSVFTRALRLWELEQESAPPREGGPVEAPHRGGPRLSVVVRSGEGAVDLDGALESVRWADEVLVAPTLPSEPALEPALFPMSRARGAEGGVSAGKDGILPETRWPWVLVIDPDERVSRQLAGEIRRVLASGTAAGEYALRRLSHFRGQPVRHGGWNRHRVRRLFHRERGVAAETVETLQYPLLRFTFRDVDDYWRRFRREADWAASRAYAEGRRATLQHLVAHPMGRFLERYLLRGGFLDGTRGLAACALSFFSVFNQYAKLWEKHQHAAQVGDPLEVQGKRA